MIKPLVITLFAIFFVANFCCALDGNVPIIPSDVEWMYVFSQQQDSLSRGSSKEIAIMITPEEFISNFKKYQNLASIDNSKLIVTAVNKRGKWVHASIVYRGERLRVARYYHQGNDKVEPGAEFPLK